eukprot:gnl/Carplike_NY0171/4620_a6276_261.p1 GENE.gnl/Carplike_NY0171/4620_a6276_261~~gnl/Carplike_NY0171/4620_a6276_261.p1  ORF type:complete len:167 (+),score=18.97 gnl/Carplike_NY0171/4620_a6276_261:112-612(+)
MSLQSKFIKDGWIDRKPPSGSQSNLIKIDLRSIEESLSKSRSSKAKPLGSVVDFLKGRSGIRFQVLSLPFVSPTYVHKIFLSMENGWFNPKTLAIKFITASGKHVTRVYQFRRMKHTVEWHELSVRVDNVVKCVLKHVSTWPEYETTGLRDIKFVSAESSGCCCIV